MQGMQRARTSPVPQRPAGAPLPPMASHFSAPQPNAAARNGHFSAPQQSNARKFEQAAAPTPAELLTAQQALDEWIKSVASMLNNRYYLFAMLTFCVMLYANLWAFLPTLRLKSVWAAGSVFAVGTFSVYNMARTQRLEKLESRALSQLKYRMVQRLTRLGDNMAEGATHTVNLTVKGLVGLVCEIVNVIVLSVGAILAIGATTIWEISLNIFGPTCEAAWAVIKRAIDTFGFAIDLGEEVAGGVVETLKEIGRRVIDAARAVDKNKGRLAFLAYAFDLLLPFDLVSSVHSLMETTVSEHYYACAVAILVGVCMIVASWMPADAPVAK